ncbi:hypothetical protein F4824DRAFT_515388 [Ustulina deusta]|nr:hypothetical protein F4824DRAFT_515388 [Ustulina deusta]
MLPLEQSVLIRSVGSNVPQTELSSPPGIPYELFIGFSWAGVAVATLFLTGRLCARFRKAGRMYLDDYCISFAYIQVLVSVALWQYAARDMYNTLNVNAGIAPIVVK